MAETPPQSRSSRLRTALLAISLMLNALIIVLVVTFLVVAGPRGPSGGRVELGLGPFSGAFSEEDRSDVRSAFRRDWRQLREIRLQRRENLSGLADALRAEPFDPATLVPFLEAERALIAEVQARGQSIFVDVISQMTPEEREALADRLLDRRLRRP